MVDRTRPVDRGLPQEEDAHERADAVVEISPDGLRKAKRLDSLNLAVRVIPDEVHTNCRPRSRVAQPGDSGISNGRRGRLDTR